ncbi:MAG: hypothetical protein COX51_05915, partial [Syntrophobacteraceae bacterium CG23_combo_of_CG06-09_8_20_14_all_50_8]
TKINKLDAALDLKAPLFNDLDNVNLYFYGRLYYLSDEFFVLLGTRQKYSWLIQFVVHFPISS